MYTANNKKFFTLIILNYILFFFSTNFLYADEQERLIKSRDNFIISLNTYNQAMKIIDKADRTGVFDYYDRVELIGLLKKSLKYSYDVENYYLDRVDTSLFNKDLKKKYEKYFRKAHILLIDYYTEYKYENNHKAFEAQKLLNKWNKYYNKWRSKFN